MQPGDDQLRPQEVDEQIEWLAQLAPKRAQEGNPNAQLVQHLQGYYQRERQSQTLDRAWQSIQQKYTENQFSSKSEEHTQKAQKKSEKVGQSRMDQHITNLSPAKRRLPRWSTLAAIVVIVLVVGSTAVIMSRVAGQTSRTGSGGGPITCIATPTAAPTPTSTRILTITPTPMPTTAATRPASTPVHCATPQPTPTQAPQGTPTPTPQGTSTQAPYPTPTPSNGNPVATPTPVRSWPTVTPTPPPTPTPVPPVTPTPTPTP